MPQLLPQSFWKRFIIAIFAAFVLVFACSTSMQPHVFAQPKGLLFVASGVFLSSIPGSLISAFTFRQNQLALILCSQVLTVAFLALFFGLRA